MTKDKSGSAFPWGGDICGGMTLRDYIATAIRQGLGSWTPPHERPKLGAGGRSYPLQEDFDRADREARAAWSYAEADAMLRAREVRS